MAVKNPLVKSKPPLINVQVSSVSDSVVNGANGNERQMPSPKGLQESQSQLLNGESSIENLNGYLSKIHKSQPDQNFQSLSVNREDERRINDLQAEIDQMQFSYISSSRNGTPEPGENSIELQNIKVFNKLIPMQSATTGAANVDGSQPGGRVTATPVSMEMPAIDITDQEHQKQLNIKFDKFINRKKRAMDEPTPARQTATDPTAYKTESQTRKQTLDPDEDH